jgi:hypothetical protein
MTPTLGLPAPDPVPFVVELQAQRVAVVRQQIRMDNAAGAFVRRAMGWRPDLPAEASARINLAAARLVKAMQSAESLPAEWPARRSRSF